MWAGDAGDAGGACAGATGLRRGALAESDRRPKGGGTPQQLRHAGAGAWRGPPSRQEVCSVTGAGRPGPTQSGEAGGLAVPWARVCCWAANGPIPGPTRRSGADAGWRGRARVCWAVTRLSRLACWPLSDPGAAVHARRRTVGSRPTAVPLFASSARWI